MSGLAEQQNVHRLGVKQTGNEGKCKSEGTRHTEKVSEGSVVPVGSFQKENSQGGGPWRAKGGALL